MTTSSNPHVAAGAPIVPVTDKGRWTLTEAAAYCNVSPNCASDMEKRGEFPPRVAVPYGKGSKGLFVAREVRAWADGLDWRSLVNERLRPEVAHAS